MNRSATSVAPRTPTEEVLIAIWAEVLRVEVGIQDNFFELGGHSLLASQVISRVREAFCMDLSLRCLFESPTVAELGEAISATRHQNPDLQVQAIEPVPRDAELPLSFAQARLWFLDQLEGQSASYNMPAAMRLQGPLHVAALEMAVQEIVQRHEVLRTTFEMVNGSPVQAIAYPTKAKKVPLVDLQSLAEVEQSALVQRLVIEEQARPFDLASGPLLRVTLLRLGEDSHVLLLTMHHIISDGWSMGIFIREVAALYEAFSKGALSPLPELPIQYADFAHWQRQWLSGEVLKTQLNYWQQQLAGAVPVLDLPTDRPRPPLQTFQGGSEQFQLNADLTRKLLTLSQQSGATLFMTMLAAFVTLLSRYSDRDDIVVGSPIANRNRRETESLIGCFVNTLVLRTDLSGNPSFEELLLRVRQMSMDAYAHQDVPFEQLVEALQPERSLSHSPLFQVMFVLQNAPMGELELPGLTLTPLAMESSSAKFDLTLTMVETQQGLLGSWEYNSDLFDPTTITRMVGHFQTLLESIVANPQQHLQDLPLLSAAQRHQILVEWNDTQVNYPQDKCIHHLFEAQVERNPDRVAVVFEDSLLTYRDLNCRANKIAHYLKTLGVGPDVLVGLCVERSLHMIIGLLGILKAGGTYIPLDPAYPQERLANMMSDAQVPVLLTQQQLVATLPEHRAEVICLDSDLQSLAQESDSNPLSGVTTKNLAYVIYTSGSTGKPKGVQIPHCAVVNFLNSMRLTPGLTYQDILLSVTTLSFDIAALELFLPLTVGASVVLVSRQVASNGSELLKQLWLSGATVMQATPATWRLLLEAGWQGSQKLKILCGGEALQRQLANDLHQRSASLWNLYGPTETTIWSTIHRVDDRNGAVPIGRPIANTQVYVLDRHLQPVPIGIPGELYIGGNGLAKGYLNRPDLTEEKFIPNPFSNQPGARLYKTGDLVRYLPDGNIEFLGRLDNQVKIRGFRIELGEISSVLAQYPGIRETIVIAREDVSGDQRLVAYLVPNQEPAPTITDLRRFLKDQLPEYMVPSAFVMLDTLPLTPNGKVDRSLLPAPEMARPELEVTFSAPQTPVEEMLALIWTSVLGVEQVGIHDNFFELGGHSLLATQVISQVRATLGVELPLRSLFEAPTVAGLAECIETVQIGKAIVAPPLYPVARDGEMPLSFAQARLWFLDQLEPGSGFYNMPGAVLINGQLNVRALERSLNEIIKRHETLRSNVQTVDGQPVQVIAETRNLTLSVVNLQSLPESERLIETLRLATEESQRPFNLANDPLVRATLLKVGEADHVFLLTIHHIIFDGWSGGVFFRELAALYSAFCNDLPSLLPELPIQYADFAVWQRQWLQGEVLEAHLSYWKQQLNGAPALLELPTDRPRPAVQTFWGAHQFLGLSKELSQALRNLSQRQGVTLFMTVLAAFQTLLYRYTGQTDVIVGAPIANRNFAQVEELIGFFANTLVLRTEMSGNPSFRELLMRVREVALGAYAYQYVPFEQLIDALQPERDVSHTPLFQVMFVLHNAPVPSVEFKNLNFTPLGIESGTAKFDLTLALTNTEQGLIGGLEYNTDLFDATTITRMQGHFQTLLEGIVANPEQRLSDLPLLTAAERDQLLVEWNRTKTDEPQDACICQMFEAQVQKTPDAIAVVFENQQLTYRELNYRANQLAHHLRSLGVGSEVLVGIYVERSLLMVVGLLGILKAGGAYVPLDPTYPPERLAYMLLDAQVSVLLTQEKWVSQLPEHQAKVICLDSDWVRIAFYSQENPTQEARGKDLAYIIYTSGSTGKPKGVMIPYKALANFTQTAISEYAITQSDRVLQFASISFDAAAEEIYPCLCAGGTLVLRTDAMLSVLWTFLKTCRELQLTVLNLPTAYWHQLTAELAITDVPLPESLRLVIIGGERALPEQVHSWQQYVTKSGKGEQLQLINTYGPTEATVTATLYRVPPTSTTPQYEVPIGRALPLVQTYILDQNQQPVPVGIGGELCIGGAGLARGYLNRPDLTEEKFIPNPFSNQPGARLYKTGDLVRYLPDGNIEFLGRLDNQVKIRGFRIELGEISSVLAQHPSIRETIVIAREDVPGDQRLVAYLVPNQELAPTITDLRRFLKDQLPEYMVPSAFVLLDTLPLTANGKVDQRALPAPQTVTSQLENAFVVPRDTLELQLTQIWEKILNVSSIGVTDNFFELGGHSFLAVRLLAQIQKQFGHNLPLTTLFHGATIEQLASILRQQRGNTSWSPLVEIQPSGSKRPFFCVHPVGGHILSYIDLGRYLGPDQPFYGLQSKGLDGQHPPYTQVEDMAAHYIEAIRVVQPQGPYMLGGWSLGGIVAFEMAQQLQRQGHKVGLLVLLDTWVPACIDKNSRGKFDDTALHNHFAKDLGGRFGKNLSISYDALGQFTHDEQLNYILEQAKLAAIIPPDVGLMQIRPLAEVYKTNIQALQSYVPQVYPNRITFFQANELLSEDLSDSVLGWDKLTSESVEIYTVPGNHGTMLSLPYVQDLSLQLRRCLDQAQANDDHTDF